MAMQLSAIYRYPIKSARGQSLTEMEMGAFGLSGDRRWMLVDDEGQFLSQRSLAALALLTVETLDDGLRLGFAHDTTAVTTPSADSDTVPVTVWGHAMQALPASAAVNSWLSTHLGQSIRLVYCPDGARREVDLSYVAESESDAGSRRHAPEGDALVAFADGYPLLVISEASLAELNGRLPQPVPMDRFRPNLVVAGAAAHAEDSWSRLRVGEAIVTLAKPCTRCVIPSIDQQSATRDPHINRALASYRRRDGEILFGVNALAQAGQRFRVGDPIDVLD